MFLIFIILQFAQHDKNDKNKNSNDGNNKINNSKNIITKMITVTKLCDKVYFFLEISRHEEEYWKYGAFERGRRNLSNIRCDSLKREENYPKIPSQKICTLKHYGSFFVPMCACMSVCSVK